MSVPDAGANDMHTFNFNLIWPQHGSDALTVTHLLDISDVQLCGYLFWLGVKWMGIEGKQLPPDSDSSIQFEAILTKCY